MDVTVAPSRLCGNIRAISSKSHAHRLLICSFLAGEFLPLDNMDVSADIIATHEALKALGNGEVSLDCGESGSTLRFLLPVVTALGVRTELLGHGRLPERPLSPLIEELEKNGAVFSAHSLPIKTSGKLRAGDYTLPGNISSQYISGLLFALPLLDGDSRINITGKIESAAYIDLTIDALKAFSIEIQKTPYGFLVPGNQKYKNNDDTAVQGDWSNAAFFLCAGALGGDITMTGLDLDCSQSDKAIFKLLSQFGAEISTDNGIHVKGTNKRNPLKIDVSPCPDLFPVLAVTACGAKGDTMLHNAARLRIKESDRIASTAHMIRSLGGEVTEGDDYLIIHGTGSLKGGTVDSFNDHRIAMAAAIAACICDGNVTIKGAQAINKSYPKFFEDYNSLGGKSDVI
ncbi:MAG: 3-phosphoshikimate 1-carboxyvinyltransferase [Clostridia bacterium]|nr:3-phosphoshikimate 1-carboxyvinyltransferase [Clostridia bacterium]